MTRIAEIVQPSGVLDKDSINLLKEEIINLLDRGSQIILVDLQDVIFLTSSGIDGLLTSLKTVSISGGTFYLCSLNEQVRAVFDETQIESTFQLLADRQEFEDRILANF